MILDMNKPETVVDYYPCRVFDANGRQLEYVMRCDTLTGEVKQLCPDGDGNFMRDFEVLRQTIMHPAPLTIERIKR